MRVIHTALVYTKAIYTRHIVLGQSRGNQVRMRKEKEVRESSSKIGSVNVGLPATFGVKNILTTGAIYGHRAVTRDV